VVRILFYLRGRIGRLPFFLILISNQMVAAAVATLAFMVVWAGPEEFGLPRGSEDIVVGVLLGFLVLAAWVYLAIGVKRLHDLDRAGAHLVWITVLAVVLGPITHDAAVLPGMLIALVSVSGLLWLVLAPGTRGPNRFGVEPGGLPSRGSVPNVG